MEIYVVKRKRKLVDIVLGKNNKYKYDLVFCKKGRNHIDCFRSKEELIERLEKKPLYKGKYFPTDNLSIREFIDRGFSIYFIR